MCGKSPAKPPGRDRRGQQVVLRQNSPITEAINEQAKITIGGVR